MTKKNEIWDVDKNLFASRLAESSSPEETNFFLNMRFKEEYEPTLTNDLIMAEGDNSLGIYIVRVNYDEYIIGCTHCPTNEIHVMNLSEALSAHLKDLGINNPQGTIGEWLHSINYCGVRFNRNFDNI